MATKKDPFYAVLGKEMLMWGKQLAEQVGRAFDPPTVEHAEPPPRITVKPGPKRETVHKDELGRVMGCIVCQKQETVDGRFCARHMD